MLKKTHRQLKVVLSILLLTPTLNHIDCFLVRVLCDGSHHPGLVPHLAAPRLRSSGGSWWNKQGGGILLCIIISLCYILYYILLYIIMYYYVFWLLIPEHRYLVEIYVLKLSF